MMNMFHLPAMFPGQRGLNDTFLHNVQLCAHFLRRELAVHDVLDWQYRQYRRDLEAAQASLSDGEEDGEEEV